MSTWTQVTVEHLDGDELDPVAVFDVIEEYVEIDYFDGDKPDHQVKWTMGLRESTPEEIRSVVTASERSKWMMDGNWDVTATALAEKFGNVKLTVVQEWDDDEPGGTTDVWVVGVYSEVESSNLRPVSVALIGTGVDLTQPLILTRAQVVDGTGFEPGTRFLVLPPEPEAK